MANVPFGSETRKVIEGMDQEKTIILIPSYNAGERLVKVVDDLRPLLDAHNARVPIVVVDDGSTDDSMHGLVERGVIVLRHEKNQGKGAALKTGLRWAQGQGFTHAVTMDADGQHPAEEALTLLFHAAREDCLVLAVRDLARAGAPTANQWSNRFSNWVLSLFGGQTLLDTQCGLRRYPVQATLDLGAPEAGYAFESDVVLRAARRAMPIVHVPCKVVYPPEAERLSYFDSVRDPMKMVRRVVLTALTVRKVRRAGLPRRIHS